MRWKKRYVKTAEKAVIFLSEKKEVEWLFDFKREC
jgi:hypothetical protein